VEAHLEPAELDGIRAALVEAGEHADAYASLDVQADSTVDKAAIASFFSSIKSTP
jgi:hypothetical protein